MEQSQIELNKSTSIDYRGHFVETICQGDNAYNVFSIFQGKNNPFESSFTILLLQISIVLVLSNILFFILKPLRQTKVVTGLLAGILLGPSFLGRNKTFEKYMITSVSKFLIKNIGIIGFMFFTFMEGVNIDLTTITKAVKKVWVLSLAGTIIPILIVFFVMKYIREFLDPELQTNSSMMTIPFSLIFTSFQVVYFILTEMKLISSEIGRLALSISVISDIFGLVMLIVFEAMKQGEKKKKYGWYYLLSVVAITTLLLTCVPPIVKWINKRTREGKTMDQNYIIATLLAIFLIGFYTDFIGAAIGTGPFWLGLIMPNGPPLGADIVHKTEVILNNILMPFAYASVGLNTDVFAIIASWSTLQPIFIVVFIAILSRLVTNIMFARFTDMSYKDSFILSVILSLKGQTEYFLCLHWMDLKIVKTPSFSLIIIFTTAVTAISCPIIDYIYDPTKLYSINKERSIEQTMKGSELRILACIYDQETVASLFSLLEFSNPTSSNPFTVFTLYHIELLGRGTPIFIDHAQHSNDYWDNNNEIIHNTIKHYAEARTDCINMRCFTSVTPNRTMYQDICQISLLYKVNFIILPFHKKFIKVEGNLSTYIRPGVQLSNATTLSHAPCSVGILACKNDDTWVTNPCPTFFRIPRQFVMLFLGGPDAREALSLAARMVEHPNVSLIVVRFLPSEINKGYKKIERKMDDGVVTRFWIQNELNHKVVYKEVFVNNGLDIVSAIQLLNNTILVDLWIVGRENGINPFLLEGLSNWSENPELGLIGDFLVSMDVNTSGGSVLIVQQQLLRNSQCLPKGCF